MYAAEFAICLGAGWAMALAFFRVKGKLAALMAGGAALAAGLLEGLLLLLDWTGMEPVLLAAVCLGAAALLPAVLRASWRDAGSAFLLAMGFAALLWSAAWNILLFAGLLGGSLVLALLIAGLFPQSGWREVQAGASEGQSPEETESSSAGAPGVHGMDWAADVLLAVLCVPGFAAVWIPAGEETAHTGLVLMAAVAWWLGFGLILAMLAYQQAARSAASEMQYRAEMETFMNVIRSQRHDYLFHVRTLAGLTRKGDLEACQAYVEELVQDSNDMNELLPIRDPAISATIFGFRALAAREGIAMHIDVENDLSHICTNVYETNKIIGNLLQNAIDEVCTHPDKSYGIWLYILKRGQYCVIHTANELLNPPEGDFFRQGYTTKQGHEGVGLTSIRILAERNRGQVYTRLEDNIIHFIAKIPLRFEANQEDRYRRDA